MPCGGDDLAYLAVAAALTAAGTGAQMAGASSAQHSMNSKMAAELQRQQEWQKQASNTFAQSLAQSGPDTAQAQMKKGSEDKLAAYNQLGAQPAVFSQPGLAVSGPVQSMSQGTTLANSNTVRANLGGLDEWSLNQMIKNIRAQQQLGLIGANSRQSASLLPGELNNASHAGDDLSGIGSLIGSLGKLTLSANAVGTK